MSNNYDNKCNDFNSLQREYEILTSQKNKLVNEADNIKTKEQAVAKREQEMTRLEIEKTCSDSMVKHTMSMFNTVFNNAALKTSIMRNLVVPVEGNPGSNGYGNTAGFIHKETVTDFETKEVSE